MAKQTIDELAIIISANAAKLPADLNKAKKEFDKFAKDVQGAHPPPPKPPDMRHLRKAHKEAAAAHSQVRAAGESVLGFMGKVIATGGTIVAMEAGISGVAGAFAELKDSVRMAADLEQTRLSFEVMLGDARRAKEVIAEVRQFAASTPFNSAELTDATRQLIAYGRSADVVVDELKMLGDVSAAMGARLPIGELTYLYGTLYAQQRAFTKDLYQFAGRGIPIWRELAKVTGKSGDELRNMVEDGRIGFEDIRQAFVAMTSAGGQFYGMTARQGQTVAGVIEQMNDGFQLLKTEVGQILIEELGIKQAAQDLERFAARLRENAGEIRPVVKFVGDLAKAGAQVGYEFGRAGIATARLNLNAYAEAVPQLRQAADLVARIVEDGGKFKLNEKDVIDAAFGFGKAMAYNVAGIGQQVGTFGEGMAGLFETIVRSAREARNYMAETAKWLDNINSAVIPTMKFLNPAVPLVGGILDAVNQRNAPLHGRRPGDPVSAFNMAPPVPGMSADRVREEWPRFSVEAARLRMQIDREQREVDAGRLRPFLLEQTRTVLADLQAREGAYLGGFDMDPTVARAHLNRGDVPAIRRGPNADGFLAQVEESISGVRRWFGDLKKMNADAIAGQLELARVRTQEARALRELDEGTRQLVASLRVARTGNPLHDFAAAGLGAMPTPQDRLGQSLATWGAALGGPLGLFKVDAPPIPPDIQALVGDIRRQYDPRRELDAFRAQLDQIQSRGLMGANTDAFVNRAWRDRLNEVAGKLGIDNSRYQLPEATAVGSAEDARIITAWRTQGAGPTTTDGLLKQILDVVAAQLSIEQQRGNAFPEQQRPQIIQLPGE
jgi:tape measure domain-containing protein